MFQVNFSVSDNGAGSPYVVHSAAFGPVSVSLHFDAGSSENDTDTCVSVKGVGVLCDLSHNGRPNYRWA